MFCYSRVRTGSAFIGNSQLLGIGKSSILGPEDILCVLQRAKISTPGPFDWPEAVHKRTFATMILRHMINATL